MKVNDAIINRFSEKFSPFYSAFSHQLGTILDSRPINEETQNNYVNVKSSEKAIRLFVNQSKKGIALFKGSQGSGKSSTLFYLHKEYRNKKTSRSILIDLRQHGTKIPQQLGQIKELENRVNACIPHVRELLSSRFQAYSKYIVSKNSLDLNRVKLDTFKYCLKYHLQVIPVKFREFDFSDKFLNTADFQKLLSVELVKDYSFHDAFYFMMMCYCLSEIEKVRKIIITVDNSDQLPYEMMEATVFCANHFSGCINASIPRQKRNKSIIAGKLSINFIIACRHHNYERLMERSNVNALGSHSHTSISHHGMPGLFKIMRKRIKSVEKFGSYYFKRGIRLSDVNSKKCITAFFKQLDNSGCYEQLLLIHNNNLADTFDSIKTISQNRYFPQFDQFVEHFHFGSKANRKYILPINVPTMQRCLVWGNPDKIGQTIYPPRPCEIPNIYGWNGVDLFSYLLPVRIIILLQRRDALPTNKNLISVKEIFDLLSRSITIDEKTFINTLNDMLKTKLLFRYSEGEVIGINYAESITLSHRAMYILGNIRRHSIFATAFLEDFSVMENDTSTIDAVSGKSLRNQEPEAIASLLNYCYKIELAQLTVINEKGKMSGYKSIFPSTALTDSLFEGLKSLLDKDGAISHTLKTEIEERKAGIKDILKSARGIDELQKLESGKNVSLPATLDTGIHIIVDNVKNDANRKEYLNLIAELRSELKKESRDPSTLAKLRKRFADLVKTGKDGEKVFEWSQELVDFFELLGSAAPPT